MSRNEPPLFDPTLREESEAIFTEKWIVSHVRVRDIRKTEERLQLRLRVIPHPALFGRAGFETEIGTIWDYLYVGKEIWYGIGYCQWRLFFASEVVRDVLNIASTLSPLSKADPCDKYYEVLSKPLEQVVEMERPKINAMLGWPPFTNH